MMNKIITYFAGQKFWLVLILIVIGLFVYGEVTATRLFTSSPVENWNPSGNGGSHGSHNSLHHK